MQERRNTDPWQHLASAKPAWSTGTRRELRGGLLVTAEFLITFLREREALRAVAGRRVAGMSTALPAPAGLGLRLGLWGFSAAVSFSVRGVHTARLKKELRLKKGRVCVPGGRCRTGLRGWAAERSADAQIAAPRAALSAWRIGHLALQPEERLPLQRCVWTCTDLAENVRSTLFVWTSVRLFSFLPPKTNPFRTSEVHC